MRVEFSPEAKAEFEEGERFYERQVPGLGARFREEVKQALVRLRTWPLACPVERGDIRRYILSRFPYKLLNSVESDRIYIIAAAHSHRAPDYWIERISP
ncbi:type II toxin-antitoxin system RelE/ParE family toxin [Methylococcus sp. EFPC2]|uniref:type II toxin-antitoxin system RelE/ParE family toxin n=1 Tax=Methylococcus sp. EFPC2 TaxID=2812648 RepID=UPI0019687B9D|nr:type II toxin-antitoxin system RelE/ParE family toxin [Methylococcus sp. EFPC2]QSA97218.1 type II toxin-antitoxin system RelE/ParE family toxin [Methylococcus sp. EFPC2]